MPHGSVLLHWRAEPAYNPAGGHLRAPATNSEQQDMRQARLAVVLPKYSRYGGVEQFGYRIAAELAGRGHHVDFICARQEIEATPGVNVLVMGRPRVPKHMKMQSFANSAAEMTDIGEYDCVLGLGKTLAQDIMRVGGAPLREFWRYSELAYPAGPARWFKHFRRELSRANKLTRKIEDEQYHSGCKIVAVSHFVRELIVKTYPHLRPQDSEVIYNRPDLARFRPPERWEIEEARGELNIAPDTVAIGLATSNFALKGTGPMIRALSKLPEHFHLYLASGRSHADYDRLAARLQVSKRVHFLGRVDNMPLFYQAMDIFSLPTFYDACSNAVLEALAAGLPVLSSAFNGSSYFLPPENVVQDPGDSDELAETLLRLSIQAAANRERGERPTFTWPEGIKSGTDGFAEMVEDYLRGKCDCCKL